MIERWLRAVLITTLVAAGSGCVFDADYRRTRYQCADGACPSGYTCRSGRCEPVSGGVTPGELEGCGTTDMAANDFAGDALDTADWYTWGNVTHSLSDGRLQLVNEDVESYRYGGYETRRMYLLRNSSVSLEMPDYDPATGSSLALVLTTKAVAEVAIELEGTELELAYGLVNKYTTLAKLEYDPDAHRFWQLREAQGTLYWETSADADTWTIQASTSSLPFDDLVHVKLIAGMPAGAGPVFFGEVNGGGAASDQTWCAIDSISDDFEDGLVGAVWSPWSYDSCSMFERAGALQFEFEPEGYGGCGYESLTRYDLTGRSVSVEVPGVDESGQIHTVFVLDFANDDWIALDHGGGEEPNRLVCRNNIGSANATPCSLSYDATQHRWWRFRHDPGPNVVHWETSADGKQWTSHGNYDAGSFSFSGAVISLYSESYDGAVDRMSVSNGFDNLNVGAD